MKKKQKLFLSLVVILITTMITMAGCDLNKFEAPTGVTATLLSSGSIHVTWDKVKDAKWYEIAYRTNLDSADTRRDAGSATTTTFSHSYYVSTDVTTLYYYVKAHNRNYTWEEGHKETGWSSPDSVNIR